MNIRLFTLYLFLVVLTLPNSSLAQTGAANDPFLSLGSANEVTTNGIYYFQVDGLSFSTYVTRGGFMLIATDNGAGTGDLPQSNSLSRAQRGILRADILATMTALDEVRITANVNGFNGRSRRPEILRKIAAFETLHIGSSDNAINNDWIGGKAGPLKVNATCVSSVQGSLNKNVFHVCGNQGGFHWIPSSGVQRIRWSDGEIPNFKKMFLWVRPMIECKGLFNSLAEVPAAPEPGYYCFDIGGSQFKTYVDAEGYLLIARDFGNGSGTLPRKTTMVSTKRGILRPGIIARLTDLQQVRIKSSDGRIDVASTDVTIKNRLLGFNTLHSGSNTNAPNNSWTGTGASFITGNASCLSTNGTRLHQNIIHPCGNAGTLHWIPITGVQRVRYADGEIASSESMSLWVKGIPMTNPLPIELLGFKAQVQFGDQVKLSWETAAEVNNDFFTVERAGSSLEWTTVHQQLGAGFSSSTIAYQWIDDQALEGVSYYRLKQTDYDGQYTYFDPKAVDIRRGGEFQKELYPNPAESSVNLLAKVEDLNQLIVVNSFGQDVTHLIMKNQIGETLMRLDISELSSGTYEIVMPSGAMKLFKLR